MLRRILFYVRVITIIVAPFVVMILPSNYFDKGQSICLSKRFLDIECYGCGLTRATAHFVHFEFQKAWEFNKLVFVVVPLLFLFWVKAIYQISGKKTPALLKYF